MKMTLMDENYMMVKPVVIRTKSKAGLVFNAKAGLQSNVLTYLVTDCNGEKKLKDKVVGILRSEVWPFEGTGNEKHYLVRKTAAIFTATMDTDEEMVDPYSQEAYDKEVLKSQLQAPSKLIL